MSLDPGDALPVMRPMTLEDLQLVWVWRNEWRVRRYMFNQATIKWADHVAWFQKATQNPGKHLLIFVIGMKPAGFMQFTDESPGKITEWGFYTATDAPKGCGTLLCTHGLNYGFAVLGFHKVCGKVIAYNEPSFRLHKRFGFCLEGTLRDSYFDGESYHAVYCFGLLNSEWS